MFGSSKMMGGAVIIKLLGSCCGLWGERRDDGGFIVHCSFETCDLVEHDTWY